MRYVRMAADYAFNSGINQVVLKTLMYRKRQLLHIVVPMHETKHFTMWIRLDITSDDFQKSIIGTIYIGQKLLCPLFQDKTLWT